MHILLADDHVFIRDGIKPFLEALAPDVSILEAGDLDEAVGVAERAGALDLALLDLKMPGMNGFDGIKKMSSRFPDLPIVILSAQYGRSDVLAAIENGAAGYIPKTFSGLSLINALRLILSGEKYLPFEAFFDNEDASPGAPSAKREEGNPETPFPGLSPRERETLGLLIIGLTNKQIARKLDLQEVTVKVHLRKVYRKIGASNRAQAVRISMEQGWMT